MCIYTVYISAHIHIYVYMYTCTHVYISGHMYVFKYIPRCIQGGNEHSWTSLALSVTYPGHSVTYPGHTVPNRSKNVKENRAWFYPDLPWGAPPSSSDGVNRQPTPWLLYWEIVTCIACLYIGKDGLLCPDNTLLAKQTHS